MVDPFLESINEYHKFLGHFVSQFSNLEFNLRYILQVRSGMTEEQFRVFVGFPRTSEVVSKTRKLAELANLDDDAKAAVADAFTQLDHIIKVRDRIVHYGGHPIATGEVIVWAKPSGHPRSFDPFTQQELWDASTDLWLIQQIMTYRLDPTLPESMRPDVAVNAVRRSPWRYTPPEQRRNPK